MSNRQQRNSQLKPWSSAIQYTSPLCTCSVLCLDLIFPQRLRNTRDSAHGVTIMRRPSGDNPEEWIPHTGTARSSRKGTARVGPLRTSCPWDSLNDRATSSVASHYLCSLGAVETCTVDGFRMAVGRMAVSLPHFSPHRPTWLETRWSYLYTRRMRPREPDRDCTYVYSSPSSRIFCSFWYLFLTIQHTRAEIWELYIEMSVNYLVIAS